MLFFFEKNLSSADLEFKHISDFLESLRPLCRNITNVIYFYTRGKAFEKKAYEIFIFFFLIFSTKLYVVFFQCFTPRFYKFRFQTMKSLQWMALSDLLSLPITAFLVHHSLSIKDNGLSSMLLITLWLKLSLSIGMACINEIHLTVMVLRSSRNARYCLDKPSLISSRYFEFVCTRDLAFFHTVNREHASKQNKTYKKKMRHAKGKKDQ